MITIDLMDDEEEVLLALAEVLGQFLDYVGGPAHAMHVIRILEKLCQVEESTVRDKVRIHVHNQLRQPKVSRNRSPSSKSRTWNPKS